MNQDKRYYWDMPHQRNGDDVDRTLFICDAPDS